MSTLFTWLIIRPMGWILEFLYQFIPNYGVALIVFTVLIKLLVLPLNIKSQKSMLKQQRLQPQLQELQKKYANDKEKLNRAMMTLYKENGASPTSGCLPMLIQFPLIIGLYQVLQKPISFMLGVNFNLPENINKVKALQSLVAANETLAAGAPKGFVGATMEMLANNFQIAMSNFASALERLGHIEFADWKIDFSFLGLDLSRYPSETPLFEFLFGGNVDMNKLLSTLPLLIVPVLAGVTSWILAKMTQAKTAKTQQTSTAVEAADTAGQMNKSMTLMMPMMSLVFSYTLPAGIGLYWIVSNVFQMVQQYFTAKIMNKREDEIVVIDTVKKNGKNGKKR